MCVPVVCFVVIAVRPFSSFASPLWKRPGGGRKGRFPLGGHRPRSGSPTAKGTRRAKRQNGTSGIWTMTTTTRTGHGRVRETNPTISAEGRAESKYIPGSGLGARRFFETFQGRRCGKLGFRSMRVWSRLQAATREKAFSPHGILQSKARRPLGMEACRSCRRGDVSFTS